MLAPALNLVPSGAGDEVHISVRWPLQLMVGAGLVFTSLTVARCGGRSACWPSAS